jgi:hypothetical protein
MRLQTIHAERNRNTKGRDQLVRQQRLKATFMFEVAAMAVVGPGKAIELLVEKTGDGAWGRLCKLENMEADAAPPFSAERETALGQRCMRRSFAIRQRARSEFYWRNAETHDIQYR